MRNNLNKKVKQYKLSSKRFREALIKELQSELKTLYDTYYSDSFDYINISLK